MNKEQKNLELLNAVAMPPLQRSSMVHRDYVEGKSSFSERSSLLYRRLLVFVLVFISMWFAGSTMATIVGAQGQTFLTWIIVCIFTLLFGWIALTFWTSVIGFVTLLYRKNSFSISVPSDVSDHGISESTRIALVMPIFNEDVERIFAGLRVMYESLEATSQLDHFDFFILSDSNMSQQWEKEEVAWKELCEKTQGFGRIFYRRRKIRIHKKSGNISDFCRRWGSQYKYMVVLDADSLMSGALIVKMAQIMEINHCIGILQTAPKSFNQRSFLSRMNQFASHLYGPLFLAGWNFWQGAESGFWGHNAIVRLDPFIRFCALPKLKGFGPFGGDILSHDFVEAALMRRAGWGVCLVYDLEDSYEELPPNLLAELERDCRWCRGNIQHLSLLFMKSIAFGHRLLFLNGNMFYFSAFLWVALLLFSTLYAVVDFFQKPEYFSMPHSLFPDWPIRYGSLSFNLLVITVIFLFFPKVMSVIWILISGKAKTFGGIFRLVLSVIIETVCSIFLSPIRMLFHSWFLLANLLGGNFDWKNQPRQNQRISFSKALKAHWFGSLLALLWGFVAFVFNQTLFLWLSVIIIPLFFAPFISIVMSSPKLGQWSKRLGLFLTPVEVRPPKEVRDLSHFCAER